MRKVFLFVSFGLVAANTYGLVINVPGYVTESYAQYALPDSGQAKYAEFDVSGNLYITHDGGTLMKINSSGQAENIGFFDNLQGIFYAGGTAYGNSLYFNDADLYVTLEMPDNGTSSTFSTFTGQGKPIGITVDIAGSFGGKMFVPTRYSNGSLYKVYEDGHNELFLQLGSGMSGHDIESDPTGNYGGLLYMSVSDASDIFTVWAVAPDGTASEFCEVTQLIDLEFDTTESNSFGGQLYVRRSSWRIGRISPDGSWSSFSDSSTTAIKCLTFGLDDSMYVVEEIAGNQVLVTKISAIPEPASVFLFCLGGLLIRKNQQKKRDVFSF